MRAVIRSAGWGLTLALAVAAAVQTAAAEVKPAPRAETEVVAALFAILNEGDAARRDQLIAKAFHENSVFSDADDRAEGARAIAQRIEHLRRGQGGLRYQPFGPVAHQHDALRFAYEAVDATGATSFEGVVFALLGTDGRFARVDFFVGPSAAPLP